MRVGTRCGDTLSTVISEDHPHACGDKHIFDKHFSLSVGSSPCVWGQVISILVFATTARIIPMRVGTSRCFIQTVILWQDHPHACGDKSKADININRAIGSSPCVWGQGKSKKEPQTSARIIPMRVGTSKPAVTDTLNG